MKLLFCLSPLLQYVKERVRDLESTHVANEIDDAVAVRPISPHRFSLPATAAAKLEHCIIAAPVLHVEQIIGGRFHDLDQLIRMLKAGWSACSDL